MEIRCDKDSPCSNCRIAKRICSSTGLGQKAKEPRQRVLISSQYEQKIDQIEERLGGIERLLQTLVNSVGGGQGLGIIPGGPGGVAAGVCSEISQRMSSRISPHKRTTPSDRNRSGGEDNDDDIDNSDNDGTTGPPGAGTGLGLDDDENFEGNSSLAAHTAFASEFLQSAVERTSILGGGPGGSRPKKIDDALSALRRIVDMQNRASTPQESQLLPPRRNHARVNLKDLPMPPMSLVVDKLREMKHSPAPAMQAIIYAFTDIDRFTDRCRRIYFATDDPSEGSFIIVNAGLASLYFEAAVNAQDPAERARYDACRAMCTRNLETALAQLNLMMPATIENIEALLMGKQASFSIDISRPSMAWILTTRAVHMCRTLGLHQASSIRSDEAPGETADKRLLFWCTYMLDKGLSLRMGRASSLQDYDISQPPVIDGIVSYAPYPGSEVLSMWIRHARCQGRLYERLYSPAALLQHQQDLGARVAQVGQLAAEVDELLAETRDILRRLEEGTGRGGEEQGGEGQQGGGNQAQPGPPPPSGSRPLTAATAASTTDTASFLSARATSKHSSSSPSKSQHNKHKNHHHQHHPRLRSTETELYAYILKSDEVSYLSSLTLAYRALPPVGTRSRTFADECIDAARATMRSHEETMNMVEDQALKIGHLHWTIIYAPFIPFIVIFCLVIETNEAEDLARLADFVRSLEVAKDVSPSVGKLHHLCQVLYNIALLYAEAKAQQPVDQDMAPLGNEFDMYLSQLGFMPNATINNTVNTTNAATSADQTMMNAGDLGGGGGGAGGVEDDQMRSMAQTTQQLGDWFSGNNHMLGLLEEDLSGINSFGYPL